MLRGTYLGIYKPFGEITSLEPVLSLDLIPGIGSRTLSSPAAAIVTTAEEYCIFVPLEFYIRHPSIPHSVAEELETVLHR